MNKTRPKTMLIRLSEEEYSQVKRDIKASGITQQEYLLHKVIPPKNSNEKKTELRKIYEELCMTTPGVVLPWPDDEMDD